MCSDIWSDMSDMCSDMRSDIWSDMSDRSDITCGESERLGLREDPDWC